MSVGTEKNETREDRKLSNVSTKEYCLGEKKNLKITIVYKEHMMFISTGFEERICTFRCAESTTTEPPESKRGN